MPSDVFLIKVMFIIRDKFSLINECQWNGMSGNFLKMSGI